MDKDIESIIVSDIEKTRAQKTDKINFGEVLTEARFHFLPLLSIAFFAVILFTAVIPNVQRIFNTIDEIDVLKTRDKELNNRITKLEELREKNAQMQEIIDKINFIVPTGNSEVVKFRERIAGSASFNALGLESSKSSETLQIISELESGNFGIIEIPSEFNIRGIFLGFRNFLNSLYQGKDFFVVNKMGLSGIKSISQDEWNGEINLVKYQFFADEGFDPAEVYANVSEDEVPNPDVINFLQSRFITYEESL